MKDGVYFDEHGNKFILKNDRWIVECCDEPRGLVGGEVQPDPEYVFLPKYAFSTASENKPTKMSETPETDNCVKESKHIRFLEQDHWVIDRIVTYTNPIVALCRRLERQRDGLKSAVDCASDLLSIAIAERDEAREQRDRLTEALRDIANGTSCQECGGEDQARFASESLTNQLK